MPRVNIKRLRTFKLKQAKLKVLVMSVEMPRELDLKKENDRISIMQVARVFEDQGDSTSTGRISSEQKTRL